MQTMTNDTTALLRDFTAAADDFTNLLESFAPEVFNQAPFEGSWSPAQVGDHVLKFLSGTKSALSVPKAIPGRAPDAHEPLLREIFLNFEWKAKAPASVVPSDEQIDKAQLLHALKEIRETLSVRIGEEDLLMLCAGVSFPTIGDLTGQEWVLFADYHLRRHTHQLQQMQPYFNPQ
ncbi:DinB family protein [Niabella sp.]|uniref:DinB family protein n=1 Tax=Niabella sp. TaxID=1962976 RepID=UPI0026188840|nr:DinB family protein [Niabella sp.]